MSNKLLCFFNFNNCFYEVFTNKDFKISCKKFCKSKEESYISDIEIINKVINKIADMKYIFLETIEYDKEQLRLYFNSFNQKVYISKIENEKEVACDYYKYKKLYDMYNNQIIYNYKFLNNQYIFDNFNYSMSNNDLFNNPNRNQDVFGVSDNTTLSPFNNPSENQEGFGMTDGTQSFFGSSSDNTFRTDDLESEEEANRESIIEKRRKETEKRHNRNKKIIKLTICGIVVIVVAISSVVLVTKLKGRDAEEHETENTSIEEVIENTDDQVLKKILESISDEEEWVKEQVIEQYQAENGDLQIETKETSPKYIKEKDLSIKTQEIINSINSNSNLTEEEKKMIIENYSQYFENNLQYVDDLEKLCDTLNTIKLIYDIQEETDVEDLGKRGEYDATANEITIYSDLTKVKTHEIGHAIGDFGMGITTGKLSEGYTELFNPNRDSSTYASEQIMILILEQVYGKDFMRKAYFNRSLFSDICDTFDIDKQDTNKHWNLIKKCSSFLVKYEDYAINGIKSNEGALKEIKELLSELKTEYEEVTGEKWEENELLKLCYDRFTGEHTSDKHERFGLEDIFINENGEYSYRIGKTITSTIDITTPKFDGDGNVYADLSLKTFTVSKAFDMDER